MAVCLEACTCHAFFCLLLTHCPHGCLGVEGVFHQVCLYVLYVTLNLLLGHFTWGSDTAVLHVVGASFQASPHSDFPVFLQFHFTSKSLGPMRSALMYSGK